MGSTKLVMDSSKCLTQQSSAEECDINLIVAKAKRGGDISHLNTREPMYGDFRNLPDLRSAKLMVMQAEAAFMSLDAFVRQRFDNDPAVLLDFLKDPANRDEAVKLGLVKAPLVPVDSAPVKGSSDTKKAKPKVEDE